MKRHILALAMALSLVLLTACGSKGGADQSSASVDLSAFAQQTMEDNEFAALQLLDPADEANAELLNTFYPGMAELESQQMLIYANMMSMNNGEFCLVEAKDSDGAKAAQDILQARVDSMIDGGAWYPEATQQWTNNSRVVSNGNFVMMVVHENCDDIVAAFNGLF